jgi:hypothetical protein
VKTQEMTDELRAQLALAIVEPLFMEDGSYVFRVNCPDPDYRDKLPKVRLPEVFDVAVKYDDLHEAEQLSRLVIASRGILVNEEHKPTHFALDVNTLVVVDEVLQVYPGLTEEDFSFFQM